jgi:hypothetical protein
VADDHDQEHAPRSPEPQRSAAAVGRATRQARTGTRLVVGVALLEAVAVAGAAVVAVVSGVQGGSFLLGAGVAVAAAATAYLLVEVARGFARRRRWPTGLFVTVQLLVVLVALSVGAPAVASFVAAPRVAALTLAALVVAGAGLVGVGLISASRSDRGAGPAGQH